MEFFEAQARIVRHWGYKKYNIFDVGASIGLTISRFLDLLPGSNVYGYEPLPDIAAKTKAKFSKDKNVHIFPYGLWDKDEEKVPFNRGGKVGQFSSAFPCAVWGKKYYHFSVSPTAPVAMRTLDGEVERLGIGHIHILKLDVHGAELKIFNGGHEALRRQIVDVIGVEVYFVPMFDRTPFFHEVTFELGRYGYTVYNICELASDRKIGQLMWANAIFISKRMRDKLEGET